MEGVMNGVVREVIISDGGSSDETVPIAQESGALVVEGSQGRGMQLQRGAAIARSTWLLFLHADTALSPGWTSAVGTHIDTQSDAAGYFHFSPFPNTAASRRLAFWVNLRCRVFALPYGDQGLLISKVLYDGIGGFTPLALMEDVDLARRLGRARLRPMDARAITSVEKHLRDGVMRRSAKNLWLLLQFLCGVDANRLAKSYD